MEGAASRLRDGRSSVTDTLKELQGVIDDLVQDGFKTENASDAYSSAYEELTTSLDDAAEAVNDMAQALERMADQIRDTDSSMAGGA
ncbi:MAG: WXG100 family type VII secretion target [Microbacterium sp.]|nr:WXG100 family type VII secretion target [Microbacterium sp.]MBS1898910.1 WXG100 family type VII secretion target [Actinomycetota bacterium]